MTKSSSPRAPTAHDVAARAGVSQSAVSRAFTNGASISAETRGKVAAAAADLGYRPNMLARSLINRRSKIVGVIAGGFANPFFTEAIERLAAALAAADLRILLFTAEANASVDAQVDELLSYHVSAVVLMAVGMSSRLAVECERAGIPVILFNRTIDSGATLEVVGDNEAGAAAIARRFVETGKTRLAFMAGDDTSTSRQREAAFARAVAGAGLPAPFRAVGHYTRDGAAAAARQLFREAEVWPDAVFCANDLMAIATIETLHREAALVAGRDYAIAGFDDIAMAAWPSFELTTFAQPVGAMAEEVVRFIAAAKPRQAHMRIVVPGRLVLRKTA